MGNKCYACGRESYNAIKQCECGALVFSSKAPTWFTVSSIFLAFLSGFSFDFGSTEFGLPSVGAFLLSILAAQSREAFRGLLVLNIIVAIALWIMLSARAVGSELGLTATLLSFALPVYAFVRVADAKRGASYHNWKAVGWSGWVLFGLVWLLAGLEAPYGSPEWYQIARTVGGITFTVSAMFAMIFEIGQARRSQAQS